MAVPAGAESLAALQRQQSVSSIPVRQGTSIPVPSGAVNAPAAHPVGQPTFFAGPALGQLDASNVNVIKSPPTLKLLSFVECQSHPKVYTLPPPNPANPVRCAVRALLAGQTGVVLASAGLQPYTTGQGTIDHTQVASVARARCLLAALAGLKRHPESLSESTAALSSFLTSMAPTTTTGSGAGEGTGGLAALATFLLLHAEALRTAGHWRECVFVAHGLLRLLVACVDGVRTEGAEAPALQEVGGAAATWASAQPFSDAPTAPLAERCLAFLQKRCASLPSSHMPRLLHAASSCASSALQEAGYMVVSAAALAEGCTVLAALAKAADATGAVMYELSSPSTGRGPSSCSLPQALAEGQSWLFAGLAQLSLAAVYRNNGKEAEANAAAAAVDTLPGWSRGVALLSSVLAAVSPGPMAVQAVQVENAPSGDRYTAACLAVTKAAAAMAAGKPQEALLLAECGIIGAASVVKHMLLPYVTGRDGPVTASPPTQAGEEDLALLGNTADTAAACVGGWATDPADVLIACLLIASESTRRLGTAPAGVAPGAYAVAMGMLEAAVRAAPALVLRPELVTALCTLYDSAKDHASAAGSKRLLYNTAQRFGLGLEPSVFKLA